LFDLRLLKGIEKWLLVTVVVNQLCVLKTMSGKSLATCSLRQSR